MSARRALVVGLGAIGLRHREACEALGLEVVGLSRRDGEADVAAAVAQVRPDHVVLAREAARHATDLQELAAAGFTGTVVVEKPLVTRPSELEGLSDAPFRACVVGYQLRLHPAIRGLRDAVDGDRVVAVQAQVGQHLDGWRPGRAPASTASGMTAAGGGALRELSHELDLVTWLAGPWRRVCAVGGRSGALDLDVDDRWGLLLELDGGAVATVHLDMLDRVGQRRLTLVGAGTTAAADLVGDTLRVDGDAASHPTDRDALLRDLHAAVLDDGGRAAGLCDLSQGAEVVRLIGAAERSVATGGWVVR